MNGVPLLIVCTWFIIKGSARSVSPLGYPHPLGISSFALCNLRQKAPPESWKERTYGWSVDFPSKQSRCMVTRRRTNTPIGSSIQDSKLDGVDVAWEVKFYLQRNEEVGGKTMFRGN